MNAYKALQNKFSEELSAFEGIFFAFSNEQFQQGLDKLNVTKEEIVSMGAGGFIKKTAVQDYKDMIKKHEQGTKDFLANPANLLAALVYELCNHEYGYTGDDSDALKALGMSRENIPENILIEAKRQADQ